MGTRQETPLHNVASRAALLTPDEVAAILRTTKKAIYAMIERAQLPGVVRIGRRVLVQEEALLHWLRQKSTVSPEQVGR